MSLGCVVATILLPLKDLTLKVTCYSYQPFQYELFDHDCQFHVLKITGAQGLVPSLLY